MTLGSHGAETVATPGSIAMTALRQGGAFGMLPMPAVMKGTDLVITHVNPAFCDFLGLPEDEIIGRTAREISPTDWLWHEATDRDLLAGGGIASYQMNLRRPGRPSIRAEIFKVRLDAPAGAAAGILSVIIDRTRQFDAEHRLLESQALHELVVESISDAILMLDEGGRFTFVGPNAAGIFGIEPSGIAALGVASVLFGDAFQLPDLPRDLETRNLECVTVLPDGSRRHLLVNVKPIKLGASRWLLTCRDVSDRVASADQQKTSMLQMVRALCAVVEKRDPYVVGHQDRVADLAVAIGRRMGLDEHRLEGLRLASIVHDIGKVSVPSEILNKPGRLSEPEFEIIKAHPEAGYDILKDIDFPWPVARMVREHHEAIDGSGYPLGLTGDQLLPESRILSVADVLEAVTSHRPYRAGLGLAKALDVLRGMCGSKLDPEAVDICIALVEGNEISVPGWAAAPA